MMPQFADVVEKKSKRLKYFLTNNANLTSLNTPISHGVTSLVVITTTALALGYSVLKLVEKLIKYGY